MQIKTTGGRTDALNLSLTNKKLNPSVLLELADKYETADFLHKDPSRFMHLYKASPADAEVVAFLSANLAFGRREQILSHIEFILSLIKQSDLSPCSWIKQGAYEKDFPLTDKSFYRMFTYADMNKFFSGIKQILNQSASLGEFYKAAWQNASGAAQNDRAGSKLYLHQVIAETFPVKTALVGCSKGGAAKKLNMFLRWMVRDNSPVDLGLWSHWYKKSDLLMPMDTHVIHQSVEFGFLPETASGALPSASIKNAVRLTDCMKEFFGDDPVRGDFALFGLGVDS